MGGARRNCTREFERMTDGSCEFSKKVVRYLIPESHEIILGDGIGG